MNKKQLKARETQIPDPWERSHDPLQSATFWVDDFPCLEGNLPGRGSPAIGILENPSTISELNKPS